MIAALFEQSKGSLCSVIVSGHAGYADYGQDVVCASVTSALQLTANGITEVLKVPAQVVQEENSITVRLPKNPGQSAQAFLQALQLHLTLLAEDYPGTIQVTVSEV